MTTQRRDAGTALVGVGVGAVLGAAVATLLAARPATAAPENEKMNFLVNLQTIMVQQLQRLVEIGEQLIGQVTIVIEPRIIQGQVVIPIPMDIENLNAILQATSYEGKVEVFNLSVTWTCPAGEVRELPLYVPTNMVCTRKKGRIISDFYSPDIMLDIIADRERIAEFGLPLTGPIDFDYGEHYIKREFVNIVCDNPTATDAQLTYIGIANLMEKSFFESFYQPLFELAYKAIESVGAGQ